MKINVCEEVTNLENGTYTAEIDTINEYENKKLLMKLILEDKTIFVKFFESEKLAQYSWNNIFKALNTDDTDDLIGKIIEFEIVNKKSEKNGYEFSNIKKVKLV